MSLTVVATPIGNDQDLSLRARSALSEADCIIGEERAETERRLKRWGILGKELWQLNEHSDARDLRDLLDLCRHKRVALVSDCGTPGFCDPGADLVAACREQQIKIQAVPGASSLTTFLSVCGRRTDQFYFAGFLPADREKRKHTLKSLRQLRIPLIVMDTPYRLGRLLSDLNEIDPDADIVLGLDLTTDQESVVSGSARRLAEVYKDHKAEFILRFESSSPLRRR